MGNTFAPSKPSYASVTSINPYATAYVNGAVTRYVLNNFLTNQNKTIEETVPNLFQNLSNPSLDNPISLARRRAFTSALYNQSQNAFENNVISPLSQRRMLRSSLLNDLSNNLQSNQASQIANFNNEELANALNDTQSLINFYMDRYRDNASYGQATLQNALNHANSVNSFNNRTLSSGNSFGQNYNQYIRTAAQIAAIASMII